MIELWILSASKPQVIIQVYHYPLEDCKSVLTPFYAAHLTVDSSGRYYFHGPASLKNTSASTSLPKIVSRIKEMLKIFCVISEVSQIRSPLSWLRNNLNPSNQPEKRTAIMLIATGFVVPQKTWIKVSVPNVTGAAAAASPAVLGGGVPGGVVSMPLSSIIFLQTQKTVKKKNKNIYI